MSIPLLINPSAIPAIEQHARFHRDMARATRLHEAYKNPFWTEDENIEMATRVLALQDFSGLLKNSSLRSEELESLKKILFGVVYPSIGCKLD